MSTVSETLAIGYSSRPARLDDSSAVARMLNEISIHVTGEAEESVDDVLSEWQTPGFDLDRDTRAVFNSDGHMVGYGLVYPGGQFNRVGIDIYLELNEWGRDVTTEPYLLAWAERRSREKILLAPSGVQVVMQAFTYSDDLHYKAQLEAAGMVINRHWFRMRIDFKQPPAPPIWPSGITFQISQQDEDWRPILDAIRDAWRDHWGYVETPFEENFSRWQSYWKTHFAPGYWFLAIDERSQQIAGISLCKPQYAGDEQCGWVGTLGVRRAYRERGIGMALLLQSFQAFYQAGKTHAGLGVDASSLTGATRLYERAGMYVKTHLDGYQKVLRAGVDLTPQEPGL